MRKTAIVRPVTLSLILVLAELNTALAAPLAHDVHSPAQTTLALRVEVVSDGQLPEEATSATEPEPGLHVVESNKHGIVLEFVTPEFQVEQGTSNDGPCDLITVAGYGEIDAPGWPRLPAQGTMVGIPPRAELTLSVLEADVTVTPERFNLCPVPQPIVEMDVSGRITYKGEESVRDVDAYASDSLYPASPVEVISTGFARNQRVAQLRFHPFQYNPVSGELRHYRGIRVRLDFTADTQVPPRQAEGGKGQRGSGGDRPEHGRSAGDGLQKAKRWYTPETAQLQLVSTSVDEDPFGETVAPTVVNPETAHEWRVRPDPSTTQVLLAGQNQPGYKVLLDEDGIYQMSYADLQAVGVEVGGVDPRTFQLHNQGEEVAIQVSGEADGSFDPEDYVLFYGQKMNTKYTDVNVYWLTWGKAEGLRMVEIDGSPSGSLPVPPDFQTTQRVEKDLDYRSYYPTGPDDDRWFWNTIYTTGPTSRNYNTTLRHVSTTPFSATVRGLFQGYYGNHHTRVYINGHLIDDATWPDKAEYTFEATIPHTYLVEGTNTIVVEVPFDQGGVVEVLFVNWFEIVYRKSYVAEGDRLFFEGDEAGTWEYRIGGFASDTIDVFDVTAPTGPVRILNTAAQPASDGYALAFEHAIDGEHRYVALTPSQRSRPLSIEEGRLSNLTSTANGADYIFITHGDFYPAVLPLADYRAAQGLRTAIVDVQDIYDAFTYGIFDPEAIRDFLAYAYANWTPPAPTYVLLVGDGNYDFKDNLGRGEPNYVPPYLADIDYWMGEVAVDNRYVCVSGDDVFPDMHIGRLPVKTSVEVAAMVTRIMNYEQNPPEGDWNQQVLFATDNPDSAGDFYAYSDAVADHYLPAPYTAQKVYYGLTHSTSTEAGEAILDAINEGRLVVNYVGHADVQVWATERLFRFSDAAALTNAGRLPLMVPMSCMDGYFIHPSASGQDLSSTAEGLVRAQAGGAIASWSATGMGLARAHDFLNKGLFEAIFFDDVVELGPATMRGKLYLYSNTGGYRDQIDQYTLFGDPALRLNVARADVGVALEVDPPGSLQAGDVITYTLTFFNAGPATAHHVVISDVLPAALHNPSVSAAGAAIAPREGNPFVWDVADLASGKGGVITITAVVDRQFTGTLANTAVIATMALEADTVNNAGAVSTNVVPPDPVALSVDAGPDQTANEGEAVDFNGAFIIEGTPDALTITWDFGDGGTATGTLNPTHVYADDGIYTVILTVSGGSGEEESDTLLVTVDNAAPTADAGPDQLANEGEKVQFNGVFEDPGALDTHSVEWDFGDGATARGTLNPGHAYTDDGVYKVTLTVADDDGGVASDTCIVTVKNVAPTVSARATPDLALPGQQVAFNSSIADPGSLDTHIIEWDFGDGTIATGDPTASHAYVLGGVYTVTLTVTDDDGGVGRAVVPVGVCCELYPIALHVDTIAGVEVGQKVTKIRNGIRSGKFGWLSWTGNQRTSTLVRSLTPPGDSETYVNPYDPSDHMLSTGDWVLSVRRARNTQSMRKALKALKGTVITVPVWDEVHRKGRNLGYHVVGFARVQIIGYRLKGKDRISVIFWGDATCPDKIPVQHDVLP
jgi:uncharacterized repeat protein (TIGR01451 family)